MLQNIAHAFLEINIKKIKDLQEDFDKLKTLAKVFLNVLRKWDIKELKIDIAFFVETLKYKEVLVLLYLRSLDMMSCW